MFVLAAIVFVIWVLLRVAVISASENPQLPSEVREKWLVEIFTTPSEITFIREILITGRYLATDVPKSVNNNTGSSLEF
ncbi:MAG: hypothetical protein MK188_12465 [Gammaproteobacteria bacterium]|nr:hypothetical protein [Gammaproteobacteria bacterium]